MRSEKKTAGEQPAAGNEHKPGIAFAHPNHTMNGNGAQPFGADEYLQMVEENATTGAEVQRQQLAELAQMALLSQGADDEGHAQCVVLRHAGKFAHSKSLGWLHYTGTHWTTAKAESAVNRAIVDTLQARIDAALKSGEAQKYKDLIGKSIPTASRARGVEYMLQHIVADEPDSFDREPDYLNCKNGVVDLRTGELLPHSRDWRFTYCVDTAYRPDADSSAWRKWLAAAVGSEEVDGEEVADWLQMAVGYSLTGHTGEEVLFYLFGPPRAGKGLFTETLITLLGSPLAKEADFATFTADRNGDTQNFDLAPLKPCRVVAASESKSHERFNEAMLKRVTGGNFIRCAYKHRDHFEYRPQFAIWLSSNHPVNADPDDDAVWGRMRVVMFPHSHLGKEDKTLKRRMRQQAVLEGVLAWAVAGAMQWYKLGRGGLPELHSSAKLKDEQRTELDQVQAWIDEDCNVNHSAITASSALYSRYEAWCGENGVTPKKQRSFTQALKKKGYSDGREYLAGGRKRVIYGLELSVWDTRTD